MERFTDYIPENKAPAGVSRIAIYRPSGMRVGSFPLGGLEMPELGTMRYSFGALSDVHIGYDTAEEDLRRSLTWLKDRQVDFTCVCGDLTVGNQDSEWETYAAAVAAYSGGIPVYPVAGNHDCAGLGLTDNRFRQYTGQGLFYTFTQGEDVFIMLSQIAWPSQSGSVQPFADYSLRSLQQALEENRNRRCFVFQHNFLWGGSGDPMELYDSDALWSTQGRFLESLMEYYPNAIWFHGHSHQKFQVQTQHHKANYDFDRGCHSLHIPSLAMPVNVVGGVRVEEYGESQGYVVEVYDGHILLQGMDFITGEPLLIARYCLETPLAEVAPDTYIDPTGTIL
ncbi:MAG: metallophosphoesterase [Oscillospiraceae bacterium]|nr:metallophosphoesterase [Oscillospiraceae bacterium]